MKSSGNALRLHLANVPNKELQFKICYADSDYWMYAEINKHGEMYTNVFLYM